MKKIDSLTESMEDYLEMITRTTLEGKIVRVNQLAAQLNVRPPSASKMVAKLKEFGLVRFEKYGTITLTEKGLETGQYLLWRHDMLHRFFCLLNHSDNQLKQVEMIEHFLSDVSLRNLEKLLPLLDTQNSAGD